LLANYASPNSFFTRVVPHGSTQIGAVGFDGIGNINTSTAFHHRHRSDTDVAIAIRRLRREITEASHRIGKRQKVVRGGATIGGGGYQRTINGISPTGTPSPAGATSGGATTVATNNNFVLDDAAFQALALRVHSLEKRKAFLAQRVRNEENEARLLDYRIAAAQQQAQQQAQHA
jgi:hypothetical protein